MSANPRRDGDEWRLMLTAGAATEQPATQAAVHLLTCTSMPDRTAFVSFLDVADVSHSGTPAPAAYVRDWPGLLVGAAAEPLPISEAKLLALAVSLAAGTPVDLRSNLVADKQAHIRRILEAVIIANATPSPRVRDSEGC